MTSHPIDTEDLRREMEDLAGDALARDSRWAGTVSPVEALAILDLLAATEHRATRAEADLEALQAVHRDATSHARRIIAHPDRWIAQGLVISTRHLLDALTGAVTIRGGAVQWRNHAVTAEDRADRAEARIKAVRVLLDRAHDEFENPDEADIRRALDA